MASKADGCMYTLVEVRTFVAYLLSLW